MYTRIRLWEYDQKVEFRICCRKRNASSCVPLIILCSSRNKEKKKAKQVVKNDIFYIGLLSLVTPTFLCLSFVFCIGVPNHEIPFLYNARLTKRIDGYKRERELLDQLRDHQVLKNDSLT